jgi:alpha-1,4-digalacturonate transport system permease protein
MTDKAKPKIQSYQSYKRAQQVIPYLFLAPNLFIFSIFIILPAIIGILYSFTDRSMFTFGPANFIWFENYVTLFKDEFFIKALLNTIGLVAVTVPLMFILSLLLATLLKQPIKWLGLYRSVYYWPVMISAIVIGIIWQWILAGNYSLFNSFLQSVHQLLTTIGLVRTPFTPTPTLSDPTFAWISVVLVILWSRIGYYMIIFLAALLSIPESLYEAAEMDGACRRQKFLYITFPSLKAARVMVLILVTMEIFKIYPLVVTFTGGGPFRATEFTVQYIYKMAFQHYNIGLASAMSVVMLLIVTLISGIIFFSSKRGENQ